MEITWHDLLTVMHGMGFGALFMLAFTGAIAELYRLSTPCVAAAPNSAFNSKDQTLLRVYLLAMVILAWMTVFTGAYIVYPWYRAIPPVGTVDLSAFPQRLLKSSPTTSGWHDLGMEWKEHIAWIAPIAMTMVAYVYAKYATALNRNRDLRKAVLVFVIMAFFATGVAGAFGAFLNKFAPVRGGDVIHLMQGE
jgi:hypothetical protein